MKIHIMIINNTELSGIIDFKSEFLGYIWLSDQTKPIVIKNQKIDFDLSKINPFIIEGHIIDKKNRRKNYKVQFL